MEIYDFKAIEKKWQEYWDQNNLFLMPDNLTGEKYYVLGMWAYPSGDAHMGHVRNYTITDVIARYKRMKGFEVLHPTGWDAFGLPTENAAIKRQIDPAEWNKICTGKMEKQFRSLGFSYDWPKAIDTSDPDYYRWTQWLLIRFWEAGMLYRDKKALNWCTGCMTVLANEQVEDGKCERCKSVVEQKELEQWFLRMSDYSEKLLQDIDMLTDWPSRVVAMQKNWIVGKDGSYNLHDWCISRQRYWGAPLPFVICEDCGIQPVPDDQLPVMLPLNADINPGWPPPLARIPDFVHTTCPKCNKSAERATDVLDTFVFSSWYYLRFVDPQNSEHIFDPEAERFWSPVDLYVGGVEHATVHLIYARFIHKLMYDLGLVSEKEPFKKLFAQGMVCLGGEKMSKSKGNIVSPIEIIEKYGADTLRTFILFVGPPEQDIDWSDRGIRGCQRFLTKLYKSVITAKFSYISGWKIKIDEAKLSDQDLTFRRKTHVFVNKVTQTIENDFRFNTTVAMQMQYLSELEAYIAGQPNEVVASEALELFILVISPFVPHLAEELWEAIGFKGSVYQQSWPTALDELISGDTLDIVVQVNGKKKEILTVAISTSEQDITAAAKDILSQKYDISSVKKTIYITGKAINFVI